MPDRAQSLTLITPTTCVKKEAKKCTNNSKPKKREYICMIGVIYITYWIIITYIFFPLYYIEQMDWWIRELNLNASAKHRLQNGDDLDDTLMNAAQSLLQKQCMDIGGFQNTLLGQKLQFGAVDPKRKAVQLIHTG